MADPADRTPQVDDPPTWWERTLYAVLRAILLGVARMFWRVEVHGRDNVPDEPFILAAVHRSNIDFLLVSAVARRRLRYMAKHTIWKYRLPGRLFTALGAFGVNRGTADRDAVRTCVKVLKGGEPLVMFPEGTRRSGPVVEDLFEGPAYVAARTGAPIVPVGIGGSEAAMPSGSKLIRPVKITLVIGEPIPAPVGENGRRASRRTLSDTTAELQKQLQPLFDEAQQLAGRPNP